MNTLDGINYNNANVRAGHTMRPCVAWNGNNVAATAADPVNPSGGMAHLSKMKNLAIVADICGIPQDAAVPKNPSNVANQLHKGYLNVLYGDRSARSVDHGAYDKNEKALQAYGASASFAPLPPFYLYVENDPTQATNPRGLWDAFDRAR